MNKKIVSAMMLTPLFLGMFNMAFNVVTSQYITIISVGVYWDNNCIKPVTSVDWGSLKPGSNKNIIVFVRNEGNVDVTISLETSNWNPPEAASFVNLTWNYSGETLEESDVVPVTLSLYVSVFIEEISAFAFDAIVRVHVINGPTTGYCTLMAAFISTTWTVDDDGPADFSSIQGAINSPQVIDGDSIYVYSGTYYENVVIDKTLCLIGENRTDTIIDGYGAQWTVSVNANNVTISGFTIKNGGKGLKSPIIPNGGIKLISNSSKVSNNIVTGNSYSGIWLGYYAISNGNIIENNSVHNNFYGIKLSYRSTHNKITKNNVINNYIGMQVSGSNNVLRENSIKNNTYSFGASGIQDIDISNTIDGKPIYYLVGQRNKRVPSIAGYVAAINCVNITVDDVSLRALLTGIKFVNTTESTVRRATILNCSSSDFYLLNSHSNTIRNCMLWSNTGRYIYILALRDSSHNTIIDNTIRGGNVIMSGDPYGTGIDLYNSSFNCIVGNTVVNNWDAIFLTYSNYNRIYHNNFINNTINVPIGAIKEQNTWDDGYPSGGNYWSDYTDVDIYNGPYQNVTGSDGICDTPYVIDENNQDNYPLMNPWTPTPPAITATIDINPDTLNLKSKGKWITAYIELPEGYNVRDIDIPTVKLNCGIQAELYPTEIGDYDNDGITDLIVKFNRQDLIVFLSADVGEATLTITGSVNDTPFEGTDTIRLIGK